MDIQIGLDQINLIKEKIKKQKFTVFANTASVNTDYKNIIDLFVENDLIPLSILGPQHGFIQNKQDNMIESSDSMHSLYNIPIYSLYGDTRIPQSYMLENIDIIIVDIQDLGARYYTYISSLFYILEVAKTLTKKVLILDRPNPIGQAVEGSPVHSEFKSFVGIYEIPNRHGMTIAEIAQMFNKNIGANLDIIRIKNYKKGYWDDLNLYTWTPTSPNVPHFETTLVYPGQCLLEGTNMSEGRGTTTPFETFGAPYLKHKDFINNDIIDNLKGVYFRPISFVPTFNKFKNELCNGFYLHVTDKSVFKPLKTTLAIIYIAYNNYKEFSFTDPPYEYEYKKLPIDILLGTDQVRKLLEINASFDKIYMEATKGERDFIEKRKEFLLY